MLCPSCGAKIDEDSTFCTVCGKPVCQSDATAQNETGTMDHFQQKDDTGGEKLEEKDTSLIGKSSWAEAEGVYGSTAKADSDSVINNEIQSINKEDSSPNTLNKNMSKTKLPALAAGTAFILIGFWRILSAGTSVSATSFGGDFYTYTYQGIVAVTEILADIEVTLGWILVAIGTSINIRALQ